MIEPVIGYGELPLIIGGVRESETPVGELDAVSLDVMVSRLGGGWRANAAAAGYAKDSKIAGFHSMWVQRRDGEQITDEDELVAVQCVGLIEEGEKRQRTLSAAGHIVSVGPIEKVVIVIKDSEEGTDGETGTSVPAKRRIPKLDTDGTVLNKAIVTPSGTFERWNINDPLLSISDTYFTTTKPDTQEQGTAITPVDPPDVPAYPWGSYSEPMRAQHPNGWVLDEREIEPLFRVSDADGLWRVTDHIVYYWVAVPD